LFVHEPWLSVSVCPIAAAPAIVGADTSTGAGGGAGTVIVIESIAFGVAGGVPETPAVSVTVYTAFVA
jgi:hypothetical protein